MAQPKSNNPAVDLSKIPLPTRSVEPNCMTYHDGEGVEHKIYMPQGTMRAASDHLQNKRWDELAKYEPYTNQGYKEEDYKIIDRTVDKPAE